MIKVDKIKKIFEIEHEDFHALNDISFDVSDGNIYGIIGLSGAGKTTLLRCLATLEHPTSGIIEIDGVDITQLKRDSLRMYRSNIGVVFQGYNLLMQRNVFDNIAFPLYIKNKYEKDKQIKNDIKVRVNELIKLVGLEGKEKVFPAKLSGGQKQRVAIARALATKPKFLLLDEITSALDPITTKQILGLLKEINQKEKVTMIIITHEMAAVKAICDEVAVMSYGTIVERGKVDEVLDNPQHEITQMLLGKKVLI